MIEIKPARERYQERKQLLAHTAKKSLGQNFLISDHVINKILTAAQAAQMQRIIEIGPGLGALTDGLVKLSSDLTLIEYDRNLAAYWRDQGLNVIEVDALKLDWLPHIQPNTMLVSNLPYQISSSLVVDRSLDKEPLACMILMFQKEVAQRLRAQLQDELYGFLSVLAQCFWKIDFLLEASSHDFNPPPKVASRVLIFTPRFDHGIQDKESFLKFLKSSFMQPRKFLISNLSTGLGITKDNLQIIMQSCGLDIKSRAEQLSLEHFKSLYFQIKLFREGRS